MSKKVLWWIFIIAWCTLIFWQSSLPAVESSKESMKVVEVINKFSESLLGPGKLMISEMVVRKTAHFLEYMILGILIFLGVFNKRKLVKTLFLSQTLGVLYAISDEIHQNFVPGRAMMAYDVVIDSLGIFLGVVLLYHILKSRSILTG